MEFQNKTPFFILQLYEETRVLERQYLQEVSDIFSTAQYLNAYKYNLKNVFMYLQESHISEIKSFIKNQILDESTTFLILLAEKTAPDLSELVKELNSLNVSFIGGIFPSLISGKTHQETGVIIQSLSHAHKPIVIGNLEKPTTHLRSISIPETKDKLTQLILVDGIAKNVSHFLFELYNTFGNSVNYLGCGAGSISLESKPSLITNEGIFKDAAIICLLDMKSELGVRHGWKNIEGPFVATKTEGNTIHELNWEPAFDFYKKLIHNHSGEEIEKDLFLNISKSYPFGIYKEESEFIVRDPIIADGSSITCIADVPENTILYLLTSDKKNLLNAAGSTFKLTAPIIQKAQTGLVFDCISRALFLGQDFKKELTAVYHSFQKYAPDIQPEGALSLGEIALNGQGNLEFFNKTLVTGILY